MKLNSNNKGVALMMVLFIMGLLMTIAMEVSQMGLVNYGVSSQSVNRLRAYYAAKAGIKLSLMRILLYKQAVYTLEKIDKEQIKTNKQYLDMIWRMPFTWPPMEPENLSILQKNELATLKKESFMQAQYMASIASEGAKIDINAINHPIDAIAKATREQILQLFLTQVETNEEFEEKYSDTDFNRLVFNLIDWIDDNKDSLNGGDEKSYYQTIDSDFIPPNESFKTLEELRMVEAMNDDFYDLLKNKVTIFGVNGVNVNYASQEVLMGIDPQITEEVAQNIYQHISDTQLQDSGPFGDKAEFIAFLDSQGVDTTQNNFNTLGIPLIFSKELNFHITSVGSFANVNQEIEAITFDFETIRDQLTEQFIEQEKQQGQQTAKKKSGQTQQQKETPPPSGQPRIVYWDET